VEPLRNSAGERLYTDRQIQRLNLLRMLTQHGHRISRIAHLPGAELERLLLDVGISPFDEPVRAEDSDLEHVLFGRGLAAVNAMDPQLLEIEIERARTVLTPLSLIDGVLCPLIRRVEQFPSKGPVMRATTAGMTELLTETARSVARVVAPLGSGRPMLVWNLGYPRDASLAMAAATTSLQGLRAEILHHGAEQGELIDQLRSDLPAGVVVSVPCHAGVEEARQSLTALRETLDHDVLMLCVAPVAEVFEALDQIDACEVCSTFRELAALIDTHRS
jgi:DNA-binding transcriptional MerR regulator